MRKQTVIKTSVCVNEQNYKELKSLAEELDLPMSRIINSILHGYFKSRRERTARGAR